jgi:hypothetical protein
VALRRTTLALTLVLATAVNARAQEPVEEEVPEAATVEGDAVVPATEPSPAPSAEIEEGDALAGPQLEPIAVLLLPSGDVDAATTDALGELLIAAVAERGGARIIGKEEFQAQLGQGDATTAECIESIPCLGRVGVALGVREVIAGTLGRRGDSWAFSLNRIDLRSGAVLGRVFREVEGDLAEVVRALPQSIEDLYVVAIQPGRLVVRASVVDAEVSLDGVVIGTTDEGPVRRDLVEPGPHVVVVLAAGYTRYERTIDVEAGTTFALDAELHLAPTRGFDVPWETWVFGATAFGALAGAIAAGVSSQSSAPDGLTMREQDAYYASRWVEAIAADVLYGVAIAATAGAVIPAVLSATSGAPPVTASAFITPTGGTLTLRGAF